MVRDNHVVDRGKLWGDSLTQVSLNKSSGAECSSLRDNSILPGPLPARENED